MQALFLKVLEISLTGSLFAIAVILVLLGILTAVAFVLGWVQWPLFGNNQPDATEPEQQETEKLRRKRSNG